MSQAGLIATTRERLDERDERDRLAVATPDSPSASTQSLVISSNLRAALEYDERIRSPAPGSGFGSISASGLEWGGGGLPPPPRPKSRPRTAHTSPAGSFSLPASPVSPPQTADVAGSGAGTNPYINPVPRLSYLMREDVPLIVGDQADARSIGQGSSDSHGTSSSRATDEPARASPATPSSSPPSAGGKEGPRHLRGLSSLQKVEKMIGKSKKSLGMLAEGNLKLASRRVSEVDMQGAGGTAGGEKTAASVLYASSAPNSPISAVSVSLTGRRVQTAEEAKAKERARVRAPAPGDGRGASVPQPAAAVAGGAGHSHARRSLESPISDATGSSTSTPSIATHRPISISSTIYSSTSAHSFAPPPRSPASRPTAMNDHRESFIELASPTFSPTEAQSHPFSAFSSPHDTQPHAHIPYYSHDDFRSHPHTSTKPLLAPLLTVKPPVPTAAKPDFSSRRSKSAQRPVIEHDSPNATPSPLESSPDSDRRLRDRPSTSNFLHPHERADLVRKTRKLTQLFGQTPGVGHYPVEVEFGHGHAPPRANLVGSPPNPSRRKHKPAASMLDDPIVPVYDARQRVVWPPPEDAQYVTVSARRRSVPFSPQEFSTLGGVSGRSSLAISTNSRGDASHVIEIGSQEGVPNSDWDSHTDLPDREASASPQSFIDLSDEEGPSAAFPDSRSPATPKARALHRRPDSVLSPSTPSLLDGLSLSEEQQAEEDRRRKREKLAKLHRFLGSRVPAHLVLGSLEEGVPLPPPAPQTPQTPQDDDMPGEDADARKIRLRRRRSSSAAEFAGTWSDEIDRLREDLNGREKAINVRRAVKMEKMFGVAPPQVLYHTRQAASSPGGSGATSASAPAPAKARHSPQSSAPQLHGAGPSSGRNLNQTSYKGKSKRGARPGTAESTQPLIDHAHADTGDDAWDGGGGGRLAAMSDVYLHYRHSLNSLNDIIDRDDRQSLAELHDYLSGRSQDAAEHTPTEDSTFGLAQASAVATKAERRRSMPSRMSMTSISSEWTLLPSPPPEESSFQQRRRRAAKLTQFFGVNYRDLMNEILESIEKGLEEERGRGTLKPDEVQDLLQKLRKLKTKRNNWP